MSSRKRGQASANNAGIVIILIAVLIILYILFLPPEDRAQLLGEEPSYGSGGNGGNGGSGTAKTLVMAKTPGRINPTGANVQEHKMPSFLVFTATNANELKRVDSLYVKNSAFNTAAGEVTFFYDSKTTTEPRISFNVNKGEGVLTILLNGKEIFAGEIPEGSPPPITIPTELLKDKNTLTLQTSSPGFAFWRMNEYQIESFVVSAKVTDFGGARGEQHFSIAQQEYERMEKAILEFLPDCPPREDGRLEVLLNSRPVYTTVPDCGIKATIEVSKDLLMTGDNTLVATTTQGSFLLDAPKLTTFLKDQGQPVFYFTATPSLLDAVYSGRRGLLMTLRFADASQTKRGVVEINGFKTGFETSNYIYQTPVDPAALLEGSNGIRIVPISGAIDVVELRIELI